MLNRQIAVYVPATVHGKDEAWAKGWLDMTKRTFAKAFGGFTLTETVGGYTMDSGEFIEEKIFVVTSFTDDATLAFNLPHIRRFCEEMGRSLEQEAISLQVNSGLELIRIEPKVKLIAA